MEQSLKHRVVLLCGRICSGKGSYMKDAERIVVSDIVRGIIKSSSREELQNTMHLDLSITAGIIEQIGGLFKKEVSEIVVDGIRQVSIVELVLAHFPDAELVWLEVPVEERKRRYENRKDTKDVELFEIADNKPIELECQNIFSTFRDKLTIINNY